MRFLILFFLFSLSLFAQPKIISEKLKANKLVLKIATNLNYSIKKNHNKKIIEIPGYEELSLPGLPALLYNDLIISLPSFEKPEIKFTILGSKKIKAIPKFNRNYIVDKKNNFRYSESSPQTEKIQKQKRFEIKGYFWIDDSYCVDIQVLPAMFNIRENLVELVDSFKIEIAFTSSNFAFRTKKDKKSIFNTQYILNTDFVNKYNLKNNWDWIDYSKQYIKIGVAKDGIYRITKNELANYIDLNSVLPKTLKLLLKGEEIPIYVKGEDDGSFDDSDYVEFVGIRNMGGHHRELSASDEPYNEYLGRYTDTTVYWLTWGGENGKRIALFDGTQITSTDTLEYYSQIEHYEKNYWLDFSCSSQAIREMPYWCSNKTWHEGNLNVGQRNKSFTCSEIYPNQPARVFIKLQDYASDINTNAHKITMGINSGSWSDTVAFNKYQKIVLNNEINSSLLNEGNNTLNIVSLNTAASLNVCIFDWYEVEYPRYLKTFNDSLNFLFPFIENSFIKTVKLQNVQTENYQLWRYGDEYKKILASKINDEVFFTDTLTNESKFIFIDENKILAPKIYYLKQFKNLRNSENKADYIAITHKKFIEQVNDYANFISSVYNVETEIIDVDDIYDEYAYGFFNPEAIKDFLMSTHEYWQTPYPQYVALIGGANYDYYGYKHLYFGANEVVNYVPSYGAPVSDNWFVIWDSLSYLMQMDIGRIPVTTNEEFDWYFSKHQNYVEQPYNAWNKKYIFFSGGNFTDPAQIDMFKSANDYIIENYVEPNPVGGNATHFYKTVDPVTNFGPYSPEEIQSTIEQGSIFIGYLGHSGTQTWDNSITQASQLWNNVNRNPVITDFGCSTARFAEPDITSFSEEFTVKPDGQAINYIGNSSLGFTTTSTTFPKIFYKKILKDSVTTIGEAYKLAKAEFIQQYGVTDVNKLFILTNELIGDPIVNIKIPQKPNLTISSDDIIFKTEELNDAEDSVSVKLYFKNLGSVTNDSLLISIDDLYEQVYNLILSKKVGLPKFIDSLTFSLPLKNRAGEHFLRITLDVANDIDEIYEDDNMLEFSYTVLSSSIKLLADYSVENGLKDSLIIINPVIEPANNIYEIQFSENPNFSNPQTFLMPFGKFLTKIGLNEFPDNQRFWFRSKIKDTEDFGQQISFKKTTAKYFIDDSVSFSNSIPENLCFINQSINLDTAKTVFEVISAGFNDGKSAVIMKNGQNFIPENTMRGHHVCVFDDSTYEFIEYQHFDLLGGGAAVAEDYIQFLDSLTSKYLVLFAISDDGAINLSNDLKAKIKEFGSVYIDSVIFRGSWAFIGKRGATPGTMPEAFSKPFEGRVTIDSTISKLNSHGALLTSLIGPASSWGNLVVQDSLPGGSAISYRALGERSETEFDTLDYLAFENGTADLSFLNDSSYSYIKILAEFEASPDYVSPVLNSLGVDYKGFAELGTNYQVVALDKDTLDQGETANLSFAVYNVGEIAADSFRVKVDLLRPDNSSEEIYSATVTEIPPDTNETYSVAFNTANYQGEGRFKISIDTENKVRETFEDNNFYIIPFYVVGDTSQPRIEVTIDGRDDLLDWEYVSNKPVIKVTLSDDFPLAITDTSSVIMLLNGKQIYYDNPDREDVTSDENPKYTVTYSPTLETGDYTLYVNGKDDNGNYASENGVEMRFKVSTKAELLEVYNYPNPFENETYFTFKLTQIPEEMKIRIFTVAGRLIREIELSPSDLNYDFNRIYWDGRDEDGDEIANGVYFYKIVLKKGDETVTKIQKLAVMR